MSGDFPQCALLHGNLYIGGELGVFSKQNVLFCVPTNNLSSWKKLTTPVGRFGLSTYRSQLVLVGGKDDHSHCTDKVWLSGDGTRWNEMSPPMPGKRSSSCVVGCSSPECLIVAGGIGENGAEMSTMFVLVEKQWWTLYLKPVLVGCYNFILHNRHIIFVGYKRDRYTSHWAYCRIESLLECATKQDSTWKQLIESGDLKQLAAPSESRNAELFTSGQAGLQLISSGHDLLALAMNGTIYGYSFDAQSWIKIASTTTKFSRSFVLLPGKMLNIQGTHHGSILGIRIIQACWIGKPSCVCSYSHITVLQYITIFSVSFRLWWKI